jgi:hypothetical protein
MTINLTTVHSLVTPRGMQDSLVQLLYVKREQKVFVNLARLLQKIEQESPTLIESVGFNYAIQKLMSYPINIQKQVLRYSSVRWWIEVAWGLVYKHAHLQFPEMHIKMHLQDFWRIPLACALIYGTGDFMFEIVTNSQGRIMIPGTSCYIELLGILVSTRVKVIFSGSLLTLSVDGRDVPYQIHPIPMIRNLEINAVDHDHRLNGRMSFVYEELDYVGVAKWEAVLEESMSYIEKVNPFLYEEIVSWTTAVVPVVSESIDVHLSATFPQSPSIMALSYTPDSVVMSEAIVHEYHHQKLNALMEITTLMTGSYKKAIFYSPWRSDPRPLIGILHGTFVFHAVFLYLKDICGNGLKIQNLPQVHQRMHFVYNQILVAIRTLLNATELTEIGKIFVEGIDNSLKFHSGDLPQVEPHIHQQIIATLQQHHDVWLANYSNNNV